ncbi:MULTISPECIES: aromatic ring-hydroxylating dioxygenase subunit alpha [unclassified Caballeronia]|uniref:aromatic ring-hydroxylating oxygenase subunit alpha n=1 Tax=unclassified Caballeronia TaxID=2646786 RepID=UPI00285A515C|nr:MULTISPECIES: aromatic ring-hydroxylating dioxygenase subunit alpha [unclassified Caballeronia]MDR5777153.1 aromatic ring-hydroxylating dioxygenase subunit alpha [Caballeronia sp. LZ002]MDR5852622.1 aromatic ring-hydroxylating dioxygenase subunit alpha [Caballeronia sp. LZ003]
MKKIDLSRRAPAHAPDAFYQHVLDCDSRPVPEVLRLSQPLREGPSEVPVELYTSKAIHDLEVEKLWKRVWQMACREEEIPEVGDTYLYQIAHLRYIVVRTAPDRIQAFVNACLHRGRQLVDYPGKCEQFRCPYHGWAWEIDGTVKQVTGAWDFPQVSDPEEWRLPEAQVGTWGGFVFINPDPHATPLNEFLGDIDQLYERYPLEQRYIAGHAAKVINTNWKAAQEAFMEGWHVLATHPQLLPQSSNHDVQVDVFGNYARAMQVNMAPSSALKWTPSEQEMVNAMLDVRLDDEPSVKLEEGMTGRQKMADISRDALRKVLGEEAEKYCDAELVDSFYVNLFPNLHPWAAFSRICFRFRPYGDDPGKCIQDVYILSPFKGERPKPAALRLLRDDEDWTRATGVSSYLARILNQDLNNMGPCQHGLQTMARKTINFGRYQEAKIRHFHKLLMQWLSDEK